MNEEFKLAYKNLSLNEKRNQLSNELMLICELIKNMEIFFDIQSVLNVKNYDSDDDSNLSESEMLDFIYEDVYNIQRELITVFSAINSGIRGLSGD